MTQKEFFRVLRNIKSPRYIQREPGVYTRSIRLLYRGRITCPITAVCQKVTGKKLRLRQWPLASRALKLNYKFAEAIVDAVENILETERRKHLRHKLIHTFGLKAH